MLDLTNPNEKRALDRLRARALRRGYRVVKSRQREHLNNHGGLMLVETRHNLCVAGSSFDLDIAEAADWLETIAKEAA